MDKKYIAIVEDDREQAEVLVKHIEKFGREKGINFVVSCYYNATMFEARERSDFDLIFFDIELPDGDGMEIVRKMRGDGNEILVIFVTNLAQYAIKGYEVHAFDFIVKPVSYYHFALKLSAALDRLKNNQEISFWVKNKDGRFKLHASHVLYVESDKHYMTYHTTEGDIATLGTIAAAAEDLREAPFALCNRCYLINLTHVVGVRQTTVLLDNGIELQISRNKRTAFIDSLNGYLTGGK